MSTQKSQFFQGFPISFAGVMTNVDTNTPINLTTISGFQIYVQHEFGVTTAMVITNVNAALGTFIAQITSTAALATGKYSIQAKYVDASSVPQVSFLNEFELNKAIFP